MKNRRSDADSRRNLRLLFLFFIAIIVIWVNYLISRSSVHHSRKDSSFNAINQQESTPHNVSYFESLFARWQAEEPACRPPSHVDFNDPIVNDYLRIVSFKCPKQKALTILDQETGMLSHVASESYKCYYSFFKREDQADNYIIYEEVHEFDDHPVHMTNEKNLVNTSCIDSMSIKIYLNTHLFVPSWPSNQPSSPDKPSVFVFFLESLPQLSFKRFMKKTKKALDDLQNVQYLNYFVKPMDNSFPNSMAFLTGKRIPWSEEKELKEDYFDGKFRYLWDEFKDAGYVTAFEEDLSIVGVFNYGKWGFKTSPCDFNPRSYWVQMYPETGDYQIGKSMSDTSQFCFHENGPKIEFFFDHAREFMKKNQNHPFFSFYFYSQMTHENFNNYKMADAYVADFLSSIKHLLNNTILMFAGDHGFRMGTFVPTSMGRIEERMNLVSVRIPEAVDNNYPHLRKFLTANENSLLSWYDVNLMMKSIATGDFRTSAYDVGEKYLVNPMTQLVPRSRTCRDANIDEIYCVCNDVVSVDPEGGYSTFDVEPGRKAVERYISKHWKLTKCPQEVNSTIKFSYHIPGPGQNFIPIEKANITVLLLPSNVTFETSIIRDWDKEFDFQRGRENEVDAVRDLEQKIKMTPSCQLYSNVSHY